MSWASWDGLGLSELQVKSSMKDVGVKWFLSNLVRYFAGLMLVHGVLILLVKN